MAKFQTSGLAHVPDRLEPCRSAEPSLRYSAWTDPIATISAVAGLAFCHWSALFGFTRIPGAPTHGSFGPRFKFVSDFE